MCTYVDDYRYFTTTPRTRLCVSLLACRQPNDGDSTDSNYCHGRTYVVHVILLQRNA